MDILELHKPGEKAYNNNLIYVGSKFSRFTIQSIAGQYDKHIYVNALCECGVCKVVMLKTLKSGKSKSCGCLRDEIAVKDGYAKSEKRHKDLIGKTFGKLLVIGSELASDGKIVRTHARVLCECGVEKLIIFPNLINGNYTSCGCAKKTRLPLANTTHGFTHSKIYTRYHGMLERCDNVKSSSYSNYGGRGIKVCDEWKEFINFKNWAFANGYQDNLQIDRIDTYGNYEPENCRFVSNLINAGNKRNSIRVKVDGDVMNVEKAAKLLDKSRAWLELVHSGRLRNTMPDRLQLIGDYSVWSKLYPESR